MATLEEFINCLNSLANNLNPSNPIENNIRTQAKDYGRLLEAEIKKEKRVLNDNEIALHLLNLIAVWAIKLPADFEKGNAEDKALAQKISPILNAFWARLNITSPHLNFSNKIATYIRDVYSLPSQALKNSPKESPEQTKSNKNKTTFGRGG